MAESPQVNHEVAVNNPPAPIESGPVGGITVSTSHEQIHSEAVKSIAKLTNTNPEAVSPQKAQDAILSNIAHSVDGAKVIAEEGVDVLNKIIEDRKGVITGFDHNYMVGNPKTGQDIFDKREEQKAA